MESYDQQTETTVDISVLSGGRAGIILTSKRGDGSEKLYTNQIIFLPVETSKALYEQLKEHFEQEESALPEEPEEAYFYVSRQGHVLRKYDDGDWAYFDLALGEEDKLWSNGNCYTNNWGLVVNDLGSDAFPLMRITQESIMRMVNSEE